MKTESIPHDEWVTMPQYGGMQYMYSPATAHTPDDDGRVKLRLGEHKEKRRVPEYIVEEGNLAETIWGWCELFYTRYQYDVAQGRRSSYGE